MKPCFVLLFLLAAATASGGQPQSAESSKVLYLADSEIVVLQMSVLLEGEGPKLRFEKFVDNFLKNLDKNGDGVVTVDEARGRILTAREAQQMQIAAADGAVDSSPDISPKDGKISRGELLAYFKRINLLPFSVKFQPRAAAVDPNAGGMANANGEVPLFDKLDINSDKKLSVEELAKALEVLRKLDLDNDETISVAELQPLAAQPRPAARPAMNNTPAPASPFVSLASGESGPKLIRRILDKYDSADPVRSGVPALSTKNQKLSRMELGLVESEFVKYDVDGDGQLDFTELRQFVTNPATTLELTLDLSSGKVETAGNSTVPIRTTADGAAHLQFGNTQISIVAVPPVAGIDPELLVKPLFIAVDTNANGYLEKTEVPENAPLYGATFADLDSDRNGKLYLEEIVDYMKSRLQIAHNRVELTVTEQGRTLFDILDSDRDGRLAHREVRSVADKLALWDKDGDGQLSESEIPLQFRMVAAQGTLTNLGPLPQNPAMNQNPGMAARTTGPVWFRKMDRNSDGEISRREFLADLDLFEKLDLNRDGAIELSEALRAVPEKN